MQNLCLLVIICIFIIFLTIDLIKQSAPRAKTNGALSLKVTAHRSASVLSGYVIGIS